MRIAQVVPIVEPLSPTPSGDVHGTVVILTGESMSVTPVSPYRIVFRPRNGQPGEEQVLASCEEADACRTVVEPCAHRLLDQRRSGEVHLVESATGRSLARRPVWPAGEFPLPEWVAWSDHTLLPKL